MKISIIVAVCAVALLLSGCWTLSETEYPEVSIDRLATGKTISVSLAGFDVHVPQYVPVEGHEAMPTNANDRIDGPCVRENSSTNVYYATRNTVSRKLIDRVSVGLERKGYTIVTADPQYVIEVNFEGPKVRDYDVLKQAGLMVLSVFTAEKDKEIWTARLKVYDRSSMKAVFEKDYEQVREVMVWGPIPVASPACSSKIPPRASSSWALTALTDLAIADAAKFLSDKAK